MEQKVGLVERDMENSFLNLPVDDEDSLLQLQGASVSYRIAMGPQQGQKVFTLQTLPASPAVSEKRLSLTSTGNIRYELKTPYNDGTTHVFFEPLDFIAKLAALVPPPRINLTRFYGVFAPNANVRAEVTASQRGKNSPCLVERLKDSDKPYHARSMSWLAGTAQSP